MTLIESSYRKLRSNIHELKELLSRYHRQRTRLRKGRNQFARNNLLRETTNKEYPLEVDAYWRTHYGKPVDPIWHIACANVTGNEDVRYVPHHIWFEEILPFFNKLSMRPAYIDKNLTDILLSVSDAPRTTVKRIHGRYYDRDHNWISRERALDAILSGGREQIIKPSLTDNGVGVRELKIVDNGIILNGRLASLDALEGSHGSDFIIQEKIVQHPIMAAPHPSSVNTIRIVTFRWKDEVRVLMAFARFGTGGKLTDNAGTGGVCCGIGDDGRLNPVAVDEFGTIHERHPTSGYAFGQQVAIPKYDELCLEAIRLHKRIFHFDIVSWDFAVNVDTKPVFLEINFQGVSFIYQFACGKPIFGELTDEVLEHIRQTRPKARRRPFTP